MSDRPCEVWGLHRKWWGRLRDRLTCGHARHVCARVRPFSLEHDGEHECGCGKQYAKTATDNA